MRVIVMTLLFVAVLGFSRNGYAINRDLDFEGAFQKAGQSIADFTGYDNRRDPEERKDNNVFGMIIFLVGVFLLLYAFASAGARGLGLGIILFFLSFMAAFILGIWLIPLLFIIPVFTLRGRRRYPVHNARQQPRIQRPFPRQPNHVNYPPPPPPMPPDNYYPVQPFQERFSPQHDQGGDEHSSLTYRD